MHRLDRKFNYSGTKEMAQFIKANGLEKFPIAAHRYAHLSAISLYLPDKFLWNAGTQKFTKYLQQNAEHFEGHEISYDEALQRISKAFPSPSTVLVLLDMPLNQAQATKYRLLYKVDSTVFGSDERCYLYLQK